MTILKNLWSMIKYHISPEYKAKIDKEEALRLKTKIEKEASLAKERLLKVTEYRKYNPEINKAIEEGKNKHKSDRDYPREIDGNILRDSGVSVAEVILSGMMSSDDRCDHDSAHDSDCSSDSSDSSSDCD